MKTIVLAATFATLSMTFAAPMQAASTTPMLSVVQSLDGTLDRQGRRGCDTPHDIAEHPRCTKA